MALRFLGASCRFFCGLEARWKRLGGVLEASPKHFGSVLGRRQSVFPDLGGDIRVIGHF